MSWVLIADRFSSSAKAKLDTLGQMEVRTSQVLRRPTKDELEHARVIVGRSGIKVDRDLFNLASELKLVVTATSGFDHIDIMEARARGIEVLYTPDANRFAAAELTWALVLACARRLVAGVEQIKNGAWSREGLLGRELAGKRYGVVGFGRIGSRVAALAEGFGMSVLVHDPYCEVPPKYERCAFEELVAMSDVVSFHVPLTRNTRHMVHRSVLEALSPEAILVNTSRGAVIHEADLIRFLKTEGRDLRVGLDVFEKEPLKPNNELLQLANVVGLPHIGGLTAEAFEKASQAAAEEVLRFEKGEPFQGQLPWNELWFQEEFNLTS